MGALAGAKAALLSLFPGKDLGQVEQQGYVGWSVQHNLPLRQLFISQPRYALSLVARFGAMEAAPAATPLPYSGSLPRKAAAADPAVKRLYREISGSVLHLSVCTRPDLAQACSVLTRYNANPRAEHLALAKRVSRYLKGTAHFDITYGRYRSGVLSYSDADWAADDSEMRRSTSGHLVNGGAVMWTSRLQKTIAVSTLEAENQAAAMVVREVLRLRQLLCDLSKCPEGPSRVMFG